MTITVSITGDSGDELGRIDIEKLTQSLDGRATYSVRCAVDRVHALGLHSRVVSDFQPYKHNVLGLLLAALSTLDETELEHEDGVVPTDLDRGQHRALPTVQTRESKRGNHRSAFWRR